MSQEAIDPVASPKTVLCTACNHTYIYGGAVAIVSALRHLPPEDPGARVYVLDGGMRPAEWDKLRKSVELVSPKHEVIRLSPEMAQFEGLPQDWGTSVMTYARLTLPDLVEDERILYLDADVIVQEDVSALMSLDLEGKTVAAAQNVLTRTLGDEQLPLEALHLEPTAKYLQAGFLVMDLDRWKVQKVSQRVLEYLRDYPDNSIYWDQSALNVILYQDWKEIPATWNSPAYCADEGKDGITLDDSLLHFVGPHKPWLLGHHNKPAAKRFFEVLDTTKWKGWRPSKVRFWLKMLKLRVDRLRGKS